MRPGALDDLGLIAAIEWQARNSRSDRNPVRRPIERKRRGDRRPLATAIFRIFQESLTNVTRHASANHVEVRVEVGDQELTLEVCDDGSGITPEDAASPKSLGLLGMRERAHRFGGTSPSAGANLAEPSSRCAYRAAAGGAR